jgi:bifunctional DNA-binding transcriptional regulator/antitoxin component of YhaV-PrlF toxin-antitoxin module
VKRVGQPVAVRKLDRGRLTHHWLQATTNPPEGIRCPRVDNDGRVLLPKPAREYIGVSDNDEVDLRRTGDSLEITSTATIVEALDLLETVEIAADLRGARAPRF